MEESRKATTITARERVASPLGQGAARAARLYAAPALLDRSGRLGARLPRGGGDPLRGFERSGLTPANSRGGLTQAPPDRYRVAQHYAQHYGPARDRRPPLNSCSYRLRRIHRRILPAIVRAAVSGTCWNRSVSQVLNLYTRTSLGLRCRPSAETRRVAREEASWRRGRDRRRCRSRMHQGETLHARERVLPFSFF